ncbi:uncharacterized protein LOC129741161 [Uranotaenia lowii]|uniref:uncharacterized protein LOC129741161 n=1 Tax=Uranotaenia lowii TaxID=190385 RepID=UPI002478A4F7|nr:uncharacterized protein LOC129741161 [Uranotaenia lowii]
MIAILFYLTLLSSITRGFPLDESDDVAFNEVEADHELGEGIPVDFSERGNQDEMAQTPDDTEGISLELPSQQIESSSNWLFNVFKSLQNQNQLATTDNFSGFSSFAGGDLMSLLFPTRKVTSKSDYDEKLKPEFRTGWSGHDNRGINHQPNVSKRRFGLFGW